MKAKEYIEQIAGAALVSIILEVLSFIVAKDFHGGITFILTQYALPWWWDISLMTIILFVAITYKDLIKDSRKLKKKYFG